MVSSSEGGYRVRLRPRRPTVRSGPGDSQRQSRSRAREPTATRGVTRPAAAATLNARSVRLVPGGYPTPRVYGLATWRCLEGRHGRHRSAGHVAQGRGAPGAGDGSGPAPKPRAAPAPHEGRGGPRHGDADEHRVRAGDLPELRPERDQRAGGEGRSAEVLRGLRGQRRPEAPARHRPSDRRPRLHPHRGGHAHGVPGRHAAGPGYRGRRPRRPTTCSRRAWRSSGRSTSRACSSARTRYTAGDGFAGIAERKIDPAEVVVYQPA